MNQRKPSRDPYGHGLWSWSGKVLHPTKPGRRKVWSYVSQTREEFHLDVYEGDRYLGHLTFTR